VKNDPATIAAMPPPSSRDELGEPYVTTGVVMMSEGRAADTNAPSPKSATPLSVPALKGTMEKMCGPNLRDLQVTLEPGNKVAIQFAATSEAEGKLFFDRIQALPELAPYEVNVKVKVTTAK
jgi:hypothetical protein